LAASLGYFRFLNESGVARSLKSPLIGDAERLIADGDLTSARASLLAARTLIGLDDDTEDDDAG
jgi:hypothetical protein